MEHQYQYRKHIRYMRNIIAVVFAVIILGIALMALIVGKDLIEGIIVICIVTFFLGGEAIILWWILGRFTKVRVTTGEEAITYTNYKGNTVIKYEEITKIEFPSIKYTGGWIKIKSGEIDIRLTVVIENIQTLLLELKEQLDSRGLSDKYNGDKFYSFLKTSAYSDQSWQRIYRIWWKLLIITIVTSAVGFGVGILFKVSSLQIFLFGLVSFIYPDIIYIITEIIFGRRTAKQSNRDNFSIPERDLEYESSTYKKATLCGAVVYIVLMIASVGIGFVFFK